MGTDFIAGPNGSQFHIDLGKVEARKSSRMRVGERLPLEEFATARGWTRPLTRAQKRRGFLYGLRMAVQNALSLLNRW